MKLRHPPAGPEVDLLPAGALDRTSPRYIPEELRADYIDIDPDTEYKLRRSLRDVDNEADFETALVRAKLNEVANRRRARQVQAELTARDALQYTCGCCEQVRPVTMMHGYSKQRRLASGIDVFVCAECFDVLEPLARDALATQILPNGKTRGEAAAELYERSTK